RPHLARGPGGGINRGGIDPACEQLLQVRVDAAPIERALDERIEAERRKMSLIENDRMPQRNRLTVVRVVGQQIEEDSRSLAVAAIPGEEVGRVDVRR